MWGTRHLVVQIYNTVYICFMDDNLEDTLTKLYPRFNAADRIVLAKEATPKRFVKGEEVVRPGQYFRSVLLVLSGKIKMYSEDDDGNELFVYFLEPGAVCTLSVTGSGPLQMSELRARALEDTEVLLVPQEVMRRLMAEDTRWLEFVLENYRARMRDLLAVIDGIAFRNMEERLEFYLKRKAKAMGTNLLPLTHEEIAQDLNSSRAVVSRMLKQMENQGLVSLGRNELELRM
jgi:CRP/FNR family transcriptional regulator